MTGKKNPYPIGHPLYDTIRDLCAGQVDFEYVEFGPLFDKHVKVLAVTGGVNLGANEEEVTLTLWNGPMDGKTKSATPPGLWLRIEADSPGREHYEDTHTLGPDAPDPEPAVAEFLRLTVFERAVLILQELLAVAEQSHTGLVGAARDQSFEQLNEAVQDGFDDAGDLDDEYDADEDDSHDLLLHTWCAHSGFESINFGLRPLDEFEPFTTRATLSTETGDVALAAWLAPDTTPGRDGQLAFWLEVDGQVQRMPAEGNEGALALPAGTSDASKQQLKLAVKHLLPLHLEAFDRYIEQMDYARDDVCGAMDTVARNALDDGIPLSVEELMDEEAHDHGPELAEHEWQAGVDEFTRQCRLGFLAGVAVEESPHGKLNIRAVTMDPIARRPVELKVYWLKDDDAEPVHWLAADQATARAHGGDPMRPELLAGFPQASRGHILHAIDHLHDMVHIATDVVNVKAAEILEVLESVKVDGDVPEIVAGGMQADAIEDALAGLNGIARLYTGSIADRNIRNS